jgi:hypothetical protein
MALGRRQRRQDSLWVATEDLPRTAGHVFYERVNRVLDEHGFDRFAEDAWCRTCTALPVKRQDRQLHALASQRSFVRHPAAYSR